MTEECVECKGTGVCPDCGGSGMVQAEDDDLASPAEGEVCEACGGTGRCCACEDEQE